MKDFMGAACSGLCLIHCFGLPVLAATGTSFLGVALVANEATHLWLSAIMLVIALWAFPSGWREHKKRLPGLLAIGGAVLMAIALVMPESMEAYWVLASSFAFISGHLFNRYLLKNNQKNEAAHV